MQWFLNLKIGTKLLISNGILGILIILLSGITALRLEVIQQNVASSGEVLYAVDTLLQADRDLYQTLVAERSLIFSKPGSDDFKALVESHKENMQQARERVDLFMTYSHDQRIDDLYAEYAQQRDAWEPLTIKIREEREANTRAGRRTAMDLSFGSAAESFDAMRDKIDKMVEYTELYAEHSNEVTVNSVTETQSLIITLMIAALGLAAAVAIIIPRLIVNPMKEMSKRIDELAGGGGDLTQKLAISSTDEVGEMGNSVNRFIDSLRGLLASIVDLGQQMDTQANTLNNASQKNSEIVDGALNETNMLATSITEMTTSVQEVAQNTSNAASQAQSASEESLQGKQIVESTKSAINSLSDEVQRSATAIDTLKNDTSKIDDVVNVIRGIAEQTNLLALNAAIEAARAGEQGRGFAVVADEVRALASRTQSSTEEIQEMIGALQNSADDAFNTMQQGKQSAEVAVEQANEAWESLEKINNAIEMIADMNTQIAAATEEQSAVSSEISGNANKLSEFSHEASAVASDVKDSAGQINGVSSQLGQQLANFKL